MLGQGVGGAEILGFQPAPRWCLGTTLGSEDLQEMNEETLTQRPPPSKDKSGTIAPLLLRAGATQGPVTTLTACLGKPLPG